MLPTLIVAGGIIAASTTSAHAMNLSPKRKPNYDEGKDER